MCTQSFSSQVSNVYTFHFGANLSDHFPMFFSLHVDCLTMHTTPLPSSSVSSCNTPNIDWSKVSSQDIEKYQEMVAQRLSSLLPEIVNCCNVACTSHHVMLDNCAHQLVNTLLECSYILLLPCHDMSPNPHKIIGWNDDLKKNLKKMLIFGIEYGIKLNIHQQELSLLSRKLLRENINLLFVE